MNRSLPYSSSIYSAPTRPVSQTPFATTKSGTPARLIATDRTLPRIARQQLLQPGPEPVIRLDRDGLGQHRHGTLALAGLPQAARLTP